MAGVSAKAVVLSSLPSAMRDMEALVHARKKDNNKPALAAIEGFDHEIQEFP